MTADQRDAPVRISHGRKLFGGFIETLGVYLIWASAFVSALGLITWALHQTAPSNDETSAGSSLWSLWLLGWPVFLFGTLAFLLGFAMWGIGARLRRRGGRPYSS